MPTLALADNPSSVEFAKNRVQAELVRPLAQKQVRRFSRARPAPVERQVRITEAAPLRDKSGRAFLPFAIDVRFGDAWRENDVVGCVYTSSGHVFVKNGDGFRPAAFLLGKDVKPVAGVCENVPARS
ncbi:MAG: hypothetical protein ACOY0T_22850 [Myxococcota bacterium]